MKITDNYEAKIPRKEPPLLQGEFSGPTAEDVGAANPDPVYADLDSRTAQYGYARSKSFLLLQEKLQREKEKAWLGRRQSKDYIHGLKMHRAPKRREFSIDELNSDVLRGATDLFTAWLGDYPMVAATQREENYAHHLYSLTQGVEDNIAAKCLPIDYFCERVMAAGLFWEMGTIRKLLDAMHAFDPVEPAVGEDLIPSRVDSDAVSMTTEQAKHIQEKTCGAKDSSGVFVQPKVKAFMLQSLGRERAAGRVCINQFLELYNVYGVSNAKRIERFTTYLKRQVQNMEAIDRYLKGADGSSGSPP